MAVDIFVILDIFSIKIFIYYLQLNCFFCFSLLMMGFPNNDNDNIVYDLNIEVIRPSFYGDYRKCILALEIEEDIACVRGLIYYELSHVKLIVIKK